MPETRPVNLDAALNWAHTHDETTIRPHYLNQVRQLTQQIALTDLTTDELVELTALLIPAHSRILTAGLGKPRVGPLRLIRDDHAI